MMIEYRHNYPLDAANVAAVFDSSGIRRPGRDLARIERMFTNANLIISAWHEKKLVGVCRALTDFRENGTRSVPYDTIQMKRTHNLSLSETLS